MIDLRSDTVTKPTPAMREAMAQAEVGDDVYGEDPTVNRLQERAAALLGKTHALFVPSGTMGNQLSVRVQTQPGQEIIVEQTSHIVRYEQGAAGALAGVQLHWIIGRRGLITPDQVESAIRPREPHTIQTALICLEQTHNSGGGSIYPLTAIEEIRAVAERHRIPMHLDGARLFNAVVATGVPAHRYAHYFDTVTFCLSKGLGAPAGSLIVTNETDLLERLRRFRRMYGGAMRQAGILAAAGLYALTHHVERLKEDHDRAKELARILSTIPSVSVNPGDVETNIVFFELSKTGRAAVDVVASLREAGLLVSAVGGSRFRAATHLNISAADIERAGAIFSRILTR
jgi:threonine aldolase